MVLRGRQENVSKCSLKLLFCGVLIAVENEEMYKSRTWENLESLSPFAFLSFLARYLRAKERLHLKRLLSVAVSDNKINKYNPLFIEKIYYKFL